MGPSPVRAASERPLSVGSGWIYARGADCGRRRHRTDPNATVTRARMVGASRRHRRVPITVRLDDAPSSDRSPSEVRASDATRTINEKLLLPIYSPHIAHSSLYFSFGTQTSKRK